MKTPRVIVIHGVTRRRRIGIRYEHDIQIGARVKLPDGRHGVVTGPGLAGMPEVQTEDGFSSYFFPGDLRICEGGTHE